MHLQDLPNEILSIIINNLATDNFDKTLLAALASCRLVSHVLCSLATPLFFSSIRLTDYDYYRMRRMVNLNQLLAIRNIAALVHSLTLGIEREDTATYTIFSEIIHRLRHIRHLTVTFRIPGVIPSAIQDLCRSPNLRTLNVEDTDDFPTSIITSCPNVRHLTLSRMSFQFKNVYPADETSSEYSVYLDSLDIDAWSIHRLGPVIPLLAKYLSQIKNLRCSHLFSGKSVWKNGWDIILLASQTLIMLDLPCYIYCFYDELLEDNPFDLGQLLALRHVKIEIPFKDNERMFSFLNRLLSIRSSTSDIETIEITIIWPYVTYGADGENLYMLGWSTLDETLTCDKLVCLRKVVLNVKMDDELGRLELEKYLTTLFPKFSASTQHTLEIRVKII